LGKYWGDSGFGHYTWPISPPLSIDHAHYQVGIMDSDGDEQDRLSFARRNGVSVNKEGHCRGKQYRVILDGQPEDKTDFMGDRQQSARWDTAMKYRGVPRRVGQ
jgi:hypothetical protein